MVEVITTNQDIIYNNIITLLINYLKTDTDIHLFHYNLIVLFIVIACNCNCNCNYWFYSTNVLYVRYLCAYA